MAATDLPLVIVGGGRWGRTWVSVAAAARGSAKGITLAARSDPHSVQAWAETRSDLAGLEIVTNLADALGRRPRPVIAIIASRPRDHVRDVLEALRLGLDVLVEKPISVNAQGGRSLLLAAQQAGRVLAMGTEFAYLPALHQLAGEIAKRRAKPVRFVLKWEDVAGEFRHGAVKARHEEVGLLPDLLPHAFSIFQIFAAGGNLHIVNAIQSEDRGRGRIEFRDNADGRYEFHCDATAATRRRILEIESDAVSASLDFGGNAPSVQIDGRTWALDSRLAAMTSTLRLELGAFLAAVTGSIDTTFITSGVPVLLALQEQLERNSTGELYAPRE